MTGLIAGLAIALAAALIAATIVVRRRPGAGDPFPRGPRRILFPFVANALSGPALDAALRLARAESATLVPVFLARVPLHMPLDAALPRQSNIAIPLQEAIERRAAEFGIPVDARIERGRTYRHGLRQAMERERFDRIVLAAATRSTPGFGPEDVAWVLENAPGELIVLRPAHDKVITAPAAVPVERGARLRANDQATSATLRTNAA